MDRVKLSQQTSNPAAPASCAKHACRSSAGEYAERCQSASMAGRCTGLGYEGPEFFVPAHLSTPTDTMNKLTQRDSHFGRVPSNSTKRMGNLAIYEECLAIRRRLAEVDPRNSGSMTRLVC
jgi:hypothetical protein